MCKMRLSVIINQCILIFSIIMLFVGTMIWYTGFHNVDLCHNEKVIENEFNRQLLNRGQAWKYTLTEQYSEGKWTLDECYVFGLTQLRGGFFLTVGAAFIVGYMLRARRT